MKKLLLLLLLVGFNANGADIPIDTSRHGLEGIAKDGLKIIIEDISKADKTFPEEAIENQVKLRLLQAGIKVDKSVGLPYLYLNATPVEVSSRVIGYHLAVKAKRRMTFEANGKRYLKFGATVWSTGGIVGKDDLRAVINQCMDKFLLDYQKANPKKKD